VSDVVIIISGVVIGMVLVAFVSKQLYYHSKKDVIEAEERNQKQKEFKEAEMSKKTRRRTTKIRPTNELDQNHAIIMQEY